MGAEMNNQNHKFGLAISTPIPRADAGINACAAHWVKSAPDTVFMPDKAQDSAPQVSSNPRPSIDGLPCAIPPGAQLTGGGISNRPQSLSFQSGDHFPNEFASSFPSHSQITSSGLKP
jgi:hypothetical protein